MKTSILLMVFTFSTALAIGQSARKTDTSTIITAPAYEMKQYFFVMLSKGANRSQDSVTAAKIQEGHMANITRLAQAGKLIVAGPFADEGNWRGIFIFDCKTREEVETLLQSDPAVRAGRLSYEIHPWWTAKNSVFK
jgi:uncharacterized protein YciI